MSKSRAFHNVGAAYTKDLSKNELAHVLLIGGTHNKQGSKDARVRIVVLLTLSLVLNHISILGGERVFLCLYTRGKVIHLCAVHTELLSYWSSR